MANHYDVPKWAGKPPVGTHLDVMKEDKLVQKLMLDEKKCYLFGRNPQMNDFCIDHQSCSRVHAAFVYHKHLQRAFLVDLGSTHGTFIGTVRLEAHKPTQLPPDSTFRFGASTRDYVMRQRPQGNVRNQVIEQLEKGETSDGAAMLGLPETGAELDNLTEFNTAHNRRISMLGIGEDGESGTRVKRKRRGVTFSEEEEIINPEDVDPSIGRFRNMVHTTLVPTLSKRQRYDLGVAVGGPQSKDDKHRLTSQLRHHGAQALGGGIGGPGGGIPGGLHSTNPILSSVVASRLGISAPNPAPEVEMTIVSPAEPIVHPPDRNNPHEQDILEPAKKKYAKEAWPGKKTMPALLV
uniref:Nuclear inhibitor of protein phosphatase 1 n=1 Tax=Rhodnius prolixus TaxID=13249 RepID=T1IFR1_RHOPR